MGTCSSAIMGKRRMLSRSLTITMKAAEGCVPTTPSNLLGPSWMNKKPVTPKMDKRGLVQILIKYIFLGAQSLDVQVDHSPT